MNYEEKVKELFPYANDLARMAGVAYPKSDDSPGAMWLYRVRDYLSGDWDRIMESSEPSDEIEWDALETNPYQQWLVYADLELWNYCADVTYTETATFQLRDFRTETVPAVRVSDLPDVAENLMEEIANNVWSGILQELQKLADEEADDESE